MASATKALELLQLFSVAHPEIRLSQMCRMAGRDKATTYRHLQSLEAAGLVEQNPATRHYRLGPLVMHLAQVREATVPRKDAARAALEALADATGETAHVTVVSGKTVYALSDCESPHHAARAVVDITTFPLNATASGLCAVAFGDPALMEAAEADLQAFTARTPRTQDAFRALIDSIRATGFGRAEQIFEDEIQGISAPVYDHSGHFAGAVAVACVAARFTPALETIIKTELIIAAREITRNWGGIVPAQIETAWARSVPQRRDKESAS